MMTRCGMIAVSAVATWMLLTASSADCAQPAFDCSKASHEVEQLICNDDALAKLDVTLATAFTDSQKNIDAQQLSELKATQRGWIKGRDDCWKATDKLQCVTSAYSDRIVTLQARYGLVMAGKSVYFDCSDAAKSEIIFTPFATDPPAASLVRGDESTTVIQRPSGSGVRYEGEFGISFWNKGREAMVKWPQDKDYTCTERK
ncbi:putative lipoprotein [Bradyrhizobiaceae bacterium SG-6C]|nr:putative lipoprotein [Bradyrhizobiaceae bacterium SG-6C]